MSQFAIVYMVNPSFHVNKVFREQYYKCLREAFNQSTMTGKKMLLKKNICIFALVIFNENRKNNVTIMYRVFRCVLYLS